MTNLGSVGGERDARRSTNRREGQAARVHEHRRAGHGDQRRLTASTWSGTLTPAIPPQVDVDHAPGDGPAGGYLPLSLFGIAPIAGVGDDTITNFNVPTFFYGGEPYTQLGVVSNGYVVIGGGTSADIVFTPQTSRTRPGRTT